MGNRIRPIGRVALVVLALSGLLGPVTGLILPQPVSGSLAAASELTPGAYFPIVMRPENTPTPAPTPTSPPPPELAIYDMYGMLQDWDWLFSVFGPVTLNVGTDAAKVIELREVEGDMALIVRVENIHGEPIEGQEVVFYWPSTELPLLPPEKRACGLDRGLIIPTNANGKAEFIMGGGAWYDPAVGVGPHQVWVVTEGTDCLSGLGWFDNHIHLDSVWRLP